MSWPERCIRTVSRILTGLGVLWVTTSLCCAADADPCHGWVGVWRIVPAKEGEGQATHVSVSSKNGECRVLYFRSDFGRADEALGVHVGAEELGFSSQPVSKAFRLELKRKGNSASGKMDLVHPQFKISYDRLAHRVTDKSDWDPIGEIQKKADPLGLVDLSGLLVERASTASLDEFEKFWGDEVEPSFYSLVHDVVYGPSGGLVERRKNLERILALLRQPEYQARVRKLQEEHFRVVGRIKDSVSDLFFPNIFVSMPSLGGFELDHLPFGDSFLVRIASDSTRVPVEHLGSWLAKEHLELPLYGIFPPSDTSLVAHLVREGLALHWAIAKGFAAQAFDCLPEPQAEISELPDQPSGEAKARIVSGIQNPRMASLVPEVDRVLVGVDFAKQLTVAFSVQEILSMSRVSLSERLWDYLGGN